MTALYNPSEAEFKEKSVLIAEDEEISLYYLTELLKDKFKEIYTATNGKEVIEQLEQNDIDLILMDIRMPVMDGLETTRQIREKDDKLVIIAQTAYAMKNDREESIAAGCDECVTKPINEEELFTKMISLLK